MFQDIINNPIDSFIDELFHSHGSRDYIAPVTKCTFHKTVQNQSFLSDKTKWNNVVTG